jgi:hypothetical protein
MYHLKMATSHPVWYGLMAKGGYGLPNVSPGPRPTGPAMPYSSTPYGRATPETAYGRFRGDPLTGRAACGRLQPFWTPHARPIVFTFPVILISK